MEPSRQPLEMKVAMVSFLADGHCVAVMASQVQAMQRPNDLVASPDIHPVEHWLGLKHPLRRTRPQQLVVNAGRFVTVIEVDGPVELFEVSLQSIHPLPSLAERLCRIACLRALVFHNGCLIPLLDFTCASPAAGDLAA